MQPAFRLRPFALRLSGARGVSRPGEGVAFTA